jgi:hypothetical protein
MTQQLILDEKGEFFVNTSQFAFIDTSTNVRFEPGMHVKTKQTEWMKGQPVIQKVVAEKPVK